MTQNSITNLGIFAKDGYKMCAWCGESHNEATNYCELCEYKIEEAQADKEESSSLGAVHFEGLSDWKRNR